VINVSKRKGTTDRDRWEKLQAAKADVIKSIGKQKDYQTKLKKIKPKSVMNPLAEKEPAKRISTGTALDRILSRHGGIESGSTAELYGEFASGKTQICMALAAEGITKGLVIYIDSEITFRAERFKEICASRNIDVEKYGDRLLLCQPVDWIEQEAFSLQLPEFDEAGNFLDVGIIIVDSLMRTWAAAAEFYGRDKLTYRQQLVRAHTHRLADYARRHNGVMVYTNQIYDKPVDTAFAPPESKVGSRGGRTLEHIGDYRIFLRKGRGNIRFARLIDSPDLPLLEVPFILDESGIRDIRDAPERVKAEVMGDRYGDKFLSGQVGSQRAGQEYSRKALELGYMTEEEARERGLSEKDIEKILDFQAKTMDDIIEESIEEEKGETTETEE